MPWYRIPFFLADRARGDRALAEIGRDNQLVDRMVHINFGGKRNKTAPRPCVGCGWISERECDWVIAQGKTCDLPLCAYCTFSPAPEKDICPQHVGPLKAWLAGRTNTVDGAGP